jgi:arsenate reductase-like glutaredoxin family protein
MEDQVKRYVLKEEVSRSNIRRFGSLTPDDRMTVLSLISLLKLGENRLREILTLLEDISRRNQCNVREIVDRLEIQAILSQQELTPSQRTERVKKVLMALRYPKMDQMEKAFEKTRRDLHLPSNLTIHHPSFFEGKGLRVGFEFETMEEYQAILESLSNLTHKKEFKELIQSVW